MANEQEKDLSGRTPAPTKVNATNASVSAPSVTSQVRPQTQFVMMKTCPGGLTVELNPYDFSTPAKRIIFTFDQDKAYIPAKLALGVFVTDSAMKQMEKGYFTFEKFDVLCKMAEDEGYYIPEWVANPKMTLNDIRKILGSNNIERIKQLINTKDGKEIRNIVYAARDVYSTLNMEVVRLIETTFKVSLEPINLE